MPGLDVRDVWEADREVDLADWSIGVASGLLRPSFRATVLSAEGDLLRLQVVGEKQPSGDRSALFQVHEQGLFEQVRLERWPPVAEGGPERLLLVLRRLANA